MVTLSVLPKIDDVIEDDTTVEPLHVAVIYPDLPSEPDLATYSKYAPSYDAVGINVPPKANDSPATVDIIFLEKWSDGAVLLPINVEPSERTFKIGKPDISFTVNKDPLFESFTVSNGPTEPSVLKIADPEPNIYSEPDMFKLPVTLEVPITFKLLDSTVEPDTPKLPTIFVEPDMFKLPVTNEVPIVFRLFDTINDPVTLEVPITFKLLDTVKLPVN